MHRTATLRAYRHRAFRFLLGITILCLSSCVHEESKAPISFSSYFSSKETYEEYEQAAAKGEQPVINERVYGAIVPHHLYVGPEMARFYNALARQKPKTIVILGPNHFDVGDADIQTTDGLYTTPYGTLFADMKLVQKLAETNIAHKEYDAFVHEHSVSAEVAFIRRTFPNVRILPLIVKARLSKERAQKLGEDLASVLPNDALVIASVDFSHYLPEYVANFHDQTSRAALVNGDEDALTKLEVDSPPSLVALLTYLRKKNARSVVYEKHTNSASYGGHPDLPETTSHFFFAFAKGKPHQEKAASMFFLGDTIVDRGVVDRIWTLQKPDDVVDAIAHGEDRFFYGSLVQALNLEGPIATHAALTTNAQKISFHFDQRTTMQILERMHVNTAFLANNHIEDAGQEGLVTTLSALKEARIMPVGVPHACDVQPMINATLGMCGYFDGGGLLDLPTVKKEIEEMKKKVDFVVISVHWGKEYDFKPSPRQREVAKLLVEAGADAILGHGPHVIQPLEVIGVTPVFYSVGNFLFDERRPDHSSGLAVGLFFEDKETIAYAIPLHTTNANPRVYTPEERIPFFANFQKGIEPYRTSLSGKFIVKRP